ncbi:TPA: hypothetical protein ACQYE6_004503 [Vibrio parahaemolyticus]
MDLIELAGNFMIGIFLPIFALFAIAGVVFVSKKDKFYKMVTVGTILVIVGVAMGGAISLDDAVTGFDQTFVTVYRFTALATGMLGAFLCACPTVFKK